MRARAAYHTLFSGCVYDDRDGVDISGDPWIAAHLTVTLSRQLEGNAWTTGNRSRQGLRVLPLRGLELR